ncbi:MAG TPA: hypothetical protein VNJ31_04525 [Methyloceanibacter sp.]|nr:hypothetical protein [Methyloceanibacter sp.]
MTKRFKTVALALLTLCAAFPALALPPPMPEQELVEKSDVVARVRVLSVTCTSLSKDEKSGEELPSYLARLLILESKKGSAKKGEEVLVTWRAVPEDVNGPWAVYYYPGEEVWTHLTLRSGGVSYATTWWNGKGDALKNPDTRDLPTTPGETVVAEPESQAQTPL